MSYRLTRRDAVKTLAACAAGVSASAAIAVRGAAPAEAELRVDLAPKFELSPYLFMQFMEPLGVTDSSVEAAWDHRHNKWREDVVDTTRELAPTMLRWGGIFTDFYRWREGVGPRAKRRPMINLMWGGIESNQVGTAEFVDFSQRVGAEPLMCVNFESDGRTRFKSINGDNRLGNAQEAADWVAFCNDPDNAERRSHGLVDPLPIRYWQLGNETSYDVHGFDLDTTKRKTIEFAKAMRAVDRDIKLIAWGDSGWAKQMVDETHEQIDLFAFHQMFNPDSPRNKVLEGELYRRDPAATWQQLMDAWKIHDRKIREVRGSLDGRPAKLALTECHFAIPGRDRCDVMSTWATGVAYARVLNTQQRHGDILEIATAADFCGTRWQVNAVMIPVPQGKAYLMPVARVMRLYRHHIGTSAVEVTACPPDLDVVASVSGKTLYLHVANTNGTQSVSAKLALPNEFAKATAYQIVDDPMLEVSELNSQEVMQIKEDSLPLSGKWTFPAASVTAIEVELTT